MEQSHQKLSDGRSSTDVYLMKSGDLKRNVGDIMCFSCSRQRPVCRTLCHAALFTSEYGSNMDVKKKEAQLLK